MSRGQGSQLKSNVLGYTISESLGSSLLWKNSQAFATSDPSRTPVWIQEISQSTLGDSDLLQAQFAHERIAQITHPGLVRVLQVQRDEGALVVIRERLALTPLRAILDEQGPLPPAQAVAWTIEAVAALSEVHAAAVIHGSLNPVSFGIESGNRRVKLSQEGLCGLLMRSQKILHTPEAIRDWLPYISPEQSGRMNRQLDYRSDFYSLGVLLYEMLLGQPPFHSQDPLELIHQHLALVPPAPHELNADISPRLSELVMILLAKDAQDRYQSAQGLLHDLKLILLEGAQDSKGFRLREADRARTLVIPQKLYGRTSEMALLSRDFEAACRGESRLSIVTGEPGIGKSILVKELGKAILARRGYFLAGKYDQYMKGTPYSVFIQAFQGFIDQVLTQSDQQIEEWKEKILLALSGQAQVIIETIPALELILGKQPAITALGPSESQNRFKLMFQRFIQSFTSADHPLVIYFDDVQWVDPASLDLIKFIITNPDISYLHLILSYRSNEVDAAHSVALALADISAQVKAHSVIHLPALQRHHAEEILVDLLGTKLQKRQELAALIFHKTDGNPLFMTQMLEALCNGRVLELGDDGFWHWDLTKAKAIQTSSHVLDLIHSKIARLSKRALTLVKFAACIGNAFSFKLLVQASAMTPDQVLRGLQEGLADGIILAPSLTSNHGEFYFLHDRVQEAAYGLLVGDEREMIHDAIGKALLTVLREQAELRSQPLSVVADDQVFAVTSQLNAAGRLVASRQDQEDLITLNLLAGQKAIASNAYGAATEFYGRATELMSSIGERHRHARALAAFHGLAKGKFLARDYDAASALFAECLNSIASSRAELLEVYLSMSALEAHVGNTLEAVHRGLDGLRAFGMKIKNNPSLFDFLWMALKVKLALGKRPIASLIDQGLAPDHDTSLVHGAFQTLGTTTYLEAKTYPYLTAYIAALSVYDNITKGNTKYSASTYTGWGLILTLAFSDFKQGHQFGQVGMKAVDKYQNRETTPTANLYYGCYIAFWSTPGREAIDRSLVVYHTAEEQGDFYNATLGIGYLCLIMYVKGNRLQAIDAELVKYLPFMRRARLPQHLYWILDLRRHIHSLMIGSADEGAHAQGIIAEILQEQQLLEAKEKEEQRHTIDIAIRRIYTNTYRIHYLYCMGRLREAADLAEASEGFAKTIVGSPIQLEFVTMHCLGLFELLKDKALSKQHASFRRKIRRYRKQLAKWASNCPESFAPHHSFVEATAAQSQGQTAEAITLFQKTAETAKAAELPFYEALAHERLSQAYRLLQRGIPADAHLAHARRACAAWGAHAKLKQLEQLGDHSSNQTHELEAKPASSLDLASVEKASQAIANELVLTKLLSNIMKLLLENAGAQRGALILNRSPRQRGGDGPQAVQLSEWTIEAEAESRGEQKDVRVLHGLPFEGSETLPRALLSFAIRSGERVILADAGQDPLFAQDPYFQFSTMHSAMAIPIVNQGRSVGILYLENKLIKGAFTAERVQVLALLSSQLAVSIENAVLYSEMEEQIKVRTKDIRAIFANIRYGVFTFGKNLLIHNEYSLYLQTILGAGRLEGRNFQDVLFDASSLSDDLRNKIKESLRVCFGVDRMQFDLNADSLPLEVQRKDGEQILQLDWVPIENEENLISKIMVTVRDVTELRRAELTAQAHSRELRMVGQILAIDPARFEGILEQGKADLHEALAQVSVPEQGRMKTAALQFRQLHTLKGVSRTYKLDELTPNIHATEQLYARILDQSMPWDEARLSAELSGIMDLLLEYEVLHHDKLSRSTTTASDASQWEKARALLEEGNTTALTQLLAAKTRLSLADLLSPLRESLPELAGRLGKQAPSLLLSGPSAYVNPAYASRIEGIFTHLFGNALDHGISGEQAGEIVLESREEQAGSCQLRFCDNGRGLDLQALAAKGLAKGAISLEASDEEIAALVFFTGLSTSETVTEISGRGVGMDAAQTMMRDLGGRLTIELGEALPKRFRRFSLLLDFPSAVITTTSKRS